MTTPSTRAMIVERRTYQRPKDSKGQIFETREEAWRRVIDHQRWLWERAQNKELDSAQEAELEELYELAMARKVTVSGRTRWLGGTTIAKTREASQFNCAFCTIETVHDVVDGIWLLLQGCGVGFKPSVGVLNGFAREISEIEIIPSKKVLPLAADGTPISDPAVRGCPDSVEWYSDGVWTIRLGDSAEAWAKFFGKLMAHKYAAKKLVLDFSEIRPAGYRLSGYGWISSGDTLLIKATRGICKVLNARAGQLLRAIDILDVMNHLGTVLSSRRSAEIALYDYDGTEWKDFATAKKDYFLHEDRAHRDQSNNSLLFTHKPTRRQLRSVFKIITDSGGSEPGFINAEAATKRAPYFRGVNPCAEILLGNNSFCNLVETILQRFNGDEDALHRAHWLVARANYRQTCVNLDDGILQRTWHELNEFLRLCGVGVTGVVGWEYAGEKEAWEDLRTIAWEGVISMADELNLPHPKLVTTIKPSGTQSKVSGELGDEVSEGVHKPLGRYIFNWIVFPKQDPLVKALIDAGYEWMVKPGDPHAVVICFPVEFSNIEFDKTTITLNGKEVEVEVNLESAVDQLNRYKLVMDHYVDHNCSITVSYSQEEIPEIIDWLLENWDTYVGVSWLYRNDPTKTAADLGFPYLPQEVVDEETYRAYESRLKPINFSGTDTEDMVQLDDCAGGACPIR